MKEPIRCRKGATLPRTPLYHRIAHDLRRRITAGDLPRGARLPSSRALAKQLGVSRNTVVNAYDALAAEGMLATRIGSGTRMRRCPPQNAPQSNSTPHPQSRPTVARINARSDPSSCECRRVCNATRLDDPPCN